MPSIVKGYEYDVFLSYRQKDNKYDGWVTEFVANLKKELEATFKEDISIYFDENPQDGLLETHDVDGSLKEKLKCLIFIPVISRTYCDPKSFAWNNEFLAFLKTASADGHGLKVRLPKGNLASRVLPIRIHELDTHDKQLIETELQGPLRSIDFTVQTAGVNRPLRQKDDESAKGQTSYRDQINKTANAIRDIVSGMQAKEQGVVFPEKPEPSSTTQTKMSGKKLKMPSLPTLVAIVSLLAFAVVAAIHFSEQPQESRTYHAAILTPEKTRNLTTYGNCTALSPDGRFLAFVAADSLGKTLLYVHELNEKNARLLTDTDGAAFPFWSPDGRFIGFFASGKLKKIEVTGGPAAVLCDARENGRGGTWNKDGIIVFGENVNTPLSVVSSLGGKVFRITKLDTLRKEWSHRWPSFLPDGKHFLYTSRINRGGVHKEDAIFVASLDTTETPRLITRVSSNAVYANGYLLAARNQTLMAYPFDPAQLQIKGDPIPIAEKLLFDGLVSMSAFTVSQNGILVYQQTVTTSTGPKLVWRDRSGKRLGSLSHGAPIYENVRLSPDGTQIAISHADESGDVDVWLYGIGRAIWTRFTFQKGIDRSPVWSPDGKTIVFVSDRDKRKLNLYRRPTNGERGEELFAEYDQGMVPTDWSRDGRFIVFQQGLSTNDLSILPLNERGQPGKPYFFLRTTYNEGRAMFSPDGKWIAYHSNESGASEVYIRPFPGPGGKWQVSTDGGTRARWRRDGKELYFISPDFKLMAAEIKLGRSALEVGTVRSLFEFRSIGGAGQDFYDVTADGQKFLIESPPSDEMTEPFALVVNWPGTIKKQ